MLPDPQRPEMTQRISHLGRDIVRDRWCVERLLGNVATITYPCRVPSVIGSHMLV